MLPPEAQGVIDREKARFQTFLEAWRHELPMVKIASSLCKLQHCGVCDYLNYQIDCCPRSRYEYLAGLIRRLGQHYNMQSAQRLAQDRLEETCNQSEGRAMFMKIDKMESRAVNVPCKWSLSNMSFFRDGNRLQVAIIGSWWAGAPKSPPIHLRTLFENVEETGSEMQFSAVLLNLHEKVKQEGRLPHEFCIGADNTAKETKNKFFVWALIWLLCVMEGEVLWSVLLTFLLVGHTHDKLDRLFSMLKWRSPGVISTQSRS